MILLCGKMCSGKTTIQKQLIKMGMEPIVTYTTRPPRKGEINGVSYHFITKEEFLKKKEQNFFAETTSYNVASGDIWYYGSALEDLSDDKVMIVNPYGLKQIKSIKSLEPISFYILVDDKTIIERVTERGDSIKEAARRLNADNIDFNNIDRYIDFAFKNDLGLKPEWVAEMILYTYKKVKEV